MSKFRNGDSIPHAKTEKEWEEAGKNKQPVWCYYDNDPTNGEKYGKLYNWYAVNDARGLAPAGWHIPSDNDWKKLIEYLGRDLAGKKMKSTSEWIVGNRTNESGFSGLPGGSLLNGRFFGIDESARWWSSTEYDSNTALSRYLLNIAGDALRGRYSKKAGLSLRCIKEI